MEESSNALSPPVTSQQIRLAISDFLQKRLQLKLDLLDKELEKLKEDQVDELNKVELKRQQENEKHEPAFWIKNAADRVWQIEQATHVLKYTHPDATLCESLKRSHTTNINSPGNCAIDELSVGTHTINSNATPDAAVGNAAALDVYKFLHLDINGSSLLERACANDPELAAVFAELGELDQSWIGAFAGFSKSTKRPASHKLAKQIYWPLGKGEYHLLAPLFPTSLVHGVWKTIREDRFSETAKAAREARQTGVSHPQGYREYPNVVIQNFGGTKPQNISQLNSERYGENFLLPSLPPTWHSESIRPPYRMDSVFDRLFGNRQEVKKHISALREFLVSVENSDSTLRIRNKRAELTGYICDELLQFAAELNELDAGWSLAPECSLNLAEQCWLDPERSKVDKAFATERHLGGWQDDICRRFGNWLNARLNSEKTPMGTAEAQHWHSVFDKELGMIRMELDFND